MVSPCLVLRDWLLENKALLGRKQLCSRTQNIVLFVVVLASLCFLGVLYVLFCGRVVWAFLWS